MIINYQKTTNQKKEKTYQKNRKQTEQNIKQKCANNGQQEAIALMERNASLLMESINLFHLNHRRILITNLKNVNLSILKECVLMEQDVNLYMKIEHLMKLIVNLTTKDY
jgi:hypothetical protein